MFSFLLSLASPAWGFEYATTPTGLGGLVRTLDAHRTAPRVWIHKLSFGYFQQRSFMDDYEDHREVNGGYSLTLSPAGPPLLNRAEWAASWEARNYTTHVEEPNRRIENLTNRSVGDLAFGAKLGLRQGDLWTLAAAFRGRALAPPDSGIVSLDTFSPDLILLNSLSFGALQFHLNTGYRLDNTYKLFDARAGDPAPLRSTRFAHGVVTEDSYVLGAAVEAAVVQRVTAFLEGFMFYDADGKAINSRGRTVHLDFAANPIWLTPGLKARLTHRVIGELAVDLGMLSKDFPGEEEVLPDWKLLLGISFLGFSREPAAVLQQAAASAPPAATAEPATPPTLGPPDGGEGAGRGEPVAAPQPVAREPSAGPAVEEERGAGVPSLLPHQVAFEFAQSDVPPVFEPVLDEVAKILLDHPSFFVRVEGHADQQGPEWSNARLSRHRAAAVVDALMARGVDSKRLIPVGCGETRLIWPEDTPAGHAKNRRVEFVIVNGAP